MLKKTIDIAAKDLDIVRQIIHDNIPELEVWTFGSRIAGTAREFSDLDIVLINDKPLDSLRMAILRDAFSESDLPFIVDIIEWYGLDEEFKRIIEMDYVVLQDV